MAWAKKATDRKLQFKTIDMATVTPKVAKMFEAQKTAYLAYTALRDGAEGAFIQECRECGALPETHTLRFGYRTGSPAAAVDLADTGTKASKGAIGIKDLMQFQPVTTLIKA